MIRIDGGFAALAHEKRALRATPWFTSRGPSAGTIIPETMEKKLIRENLTSNQRGRTSRPPKAAGGRRTRAEGLPECAGSEVAVAAYRWAQ